MSGTEPAGLLIAEDTVEPALVDAANMPGPPGSNAEHNAAIATGIMWQGTLRWISQVLAWTATIAIARRLSPGDYGIAGTAGVIVGLLTLVTDGGMARALIMRRERDETVLEHVHGAAVLTGGALALLMLAVAYPLAAFYAEPKVAPVVMVLSIVLLLSGANAVPLAIVQQRLQYRQLATIEFGKAISQALSVLACALLGMRYWSLTIGLIVGHAVALLWTRRYVRTKMVWPSRPMIMPTASYAMHMVVGSLCWYLYSNADFAMVGRAAGLTALGYYQFAWNIAQLPGEKLANVLQAVILPFFGSIGDNKTALRHYFLVLSLLLVSVMLPILAGFALVSPIAVPMIFGDKWAASVPLMQILVACAASSSVSLLSQHVLHAVGQANVAARQNAIALCVLPVCFWFAARSYGGLGAACVWLIAQPFLIGFPLLKLRHAVQLSVREYGRNLYAPFVCTALMAGTVLALGRTIESLAPILQLLLLSSVGAVVYIATYFVLFRPRINAILSVWRDR